MFIGSNNVDLPVEFYFLAYVIYICLGCCSRFPNKKYKDRVFIIKMVYSFNVHFYNTFKSILTVDFKFSAALELESYIFYLKEIANDQ